MDRNQDVTRRDRTEAVSAKTGGMPTALSQGKAWRRRRDPHGGVAPAAQFHDEPHIRAVMGHRECAEFASECRRPLQPVAARTREAERDVRRVVHVRTRVGPAAQRHAPAPDLPRPASGTRAACVEHDLGMGARDTEPAGAVEQHAPRVGLKASGRLRQCSPVGTSGKNRERADQRDPHGEKIARNTAELRRLTRGDRIVIPVSRHVSSLVALRGRAGAIELGTGS